MLVDGDLEEAGLSAQLGLENAHGLADILLSRDAGPLPTVPSGTHGMRCLSAGSADARQHLLISAAVLDNELPRVRETCQRIVVHGGALSHSASARLLAAKADTTILAVRWAGTPLSAIAEAAAIVREAGGSVAGIVLLDVDPKVAPTKRRNRAVQHWSASPFSSGAAPIGHGR